MEEALVPYIGLFVIYDLQTSEVGYIARQMYSDCVPMNTAGNIKMLVDICNKDKLDNHVEYMDMYGIVTSDGVTELWEEEGQIENFFY